MTKPHSHPDDAPSTPGERPRSAQALRRRAEERAREIEAQSSPAGRPRELPERGDFAASSPEQLVAQSPEQMQQTLHDLQVHQIELEMQNEELRRAQTELDVARARYFALYDLAPVGYVTISEQGLILEANLTVATLLGVGRGALVNRPLSLFILKEDQDLYYQRRKQLLESREPQAFELRMVKHDGTPFWAGLAATAAQAHSTGSGQAPSTGSGQAPSTGSGQAPSTGSGQAPLTGSGQAPSTGSGQAPSTGSGQAPLTGSGQAADGALVGGVVLTDVTERKRAEEALRESEERYQRITEAVTDYIYTVRVTDGRVADTTHGPGCLAVTGYRATEFASDAFLWFHMVVAEDGPKVEEQARRILAGEDPLPIEHRIVHKNGTVGWVRNTFVPHRDEHGALVSYDGLIQDITERKRADEQNARLEAQLQQAQKMESVGRLAGGVAHDFNNMLGVILGHCEMALDRADPAQPIHADLEEIRKAARRSADLTRQLLAFARKQTVTPKVLNLNETVAGMLKMLERLIGEDIQLIWQPAADLWPVRVDPSQIDQILANLCVNARDAIAGVGTLTIATGNGAVDEAAGADLPGVEPGEYVRLAVRDDGCGMDPDTLTHMFEPFFTTKGVGEGTGLGLATVYGAVKQNAGFINARSEPGAGTTFTIYLPRHVGKAEQGPAEGAAGAPVRGQETILLVEDEPTILTLTTEVLERQGYTVLPASTPGEAIRLAGEHAGQIHLLMTDVVMPGMNGRDLARNLLSLYPTLKRLFMSGYTADVVAHHGIVDEGVNFLQKPFSIGDLAAKVREVLDRGSQPGG